MPRQIVHKKVKPPRQGGSLIPAKCKTAQRYKKKGPNS